MKNFPESIKINLKYVKAKILIKFIYIYICDYNYTKHFMIRLEGLIFHFFSYQNIMIPVLFFFTFHDF